MDAATYTERLKARRAELSSVKSRDDRLGNVRLGLVALAFVLLLLPLYTRGGTPWLLLVPLGVVFFVLGRVHDRVQDLRRRLTASVRYYEEGTARQEERWRTLEDDGADLLEIAKAGDLPHASWAKDLDLFGPASLFQLLNRAVTEQGRQTLASWLSLHAETDEVSARQAAVAEMAEALDFSEELHRAAAGEDHRPVPNSELLHWGQDIKPLPAPGLLAFVGIAFPVALFASIALYVLQDELRPLVIVALAQIAFVFLSHRLTAGRANVLSGPERVLIRYARLFETISTAEHKAPRLVELQAKLRAADRPAHEHVAKLVRWVELLDARLNVFFALTLGPALLWELNLVLRTERWRAEVGPRLAGWFEAVGEIEALASLGALARERPDYSFPDLASDAVVWEAEGLSHPLIDRTAVVSNDADLVGAGYVLLLSGSNMSGKSTFLRSVGLATVMAQCGSVVAAKGLKLSPFRLETSVRVDDSLAEGTSHFYAELARLKAVMDAVTGPRTLLYLLDEVLHGTNSRERVIGAMAVIEHLSGQGAVGIVTTHDLGLARLDERLGALAANKHFSDRAQEGSIAFDYQLRPGPIETTNALRLMRQIGIDLDFDGLAAALEKN